MMMIILSIVTWFAQAATETQISEVPQLGQTPDADWLAIQPQTIFADGRGLPAGNGNVSQGASLYKAQCAGCHGSNGEGGSAIELVGDRSLLNTEYPDRGIAVYWPYAPPLFAYVQRSMPPDKPYSLSDDETYAVVAQLLYLNKLIGEGQVVDAAFLASLKLPNRTGFRSLVEHGPVD